MNEYNLHMKEKLKDYIKDIFEIELKDELIKILYHCSPGLNDEINSYAVIGDKLVDFLDSKENKGESAQFLDNFRQSHSSNEFWINCFDEFQFNKLVSYNKENALGQKMKSTFIEALIFCFYEDTKDLDKTYEAIKKIRNYKKA